MISIDLEKLFYAPFSSMQTIRREFHEVDSDTNFVSKSEVTKLYSWE